MGGGEERWRGELGRRAWLAVALVMWLIGCATAARLDDTFDADPLGAKPSATPSPTPPSDFEAWNGTDHLISTVAAPDPSGGRWVRIVPDAGFIASPDHRHQAATVNSDALTTSPPASLRGHMRLRLDGLGTVTIGFRPLQGSKLSDSDFMGGVAIGSYLPPAGGQVYLVAPFTDANVAAPVGLVSAGKIAGYVPGSVVDIEWSIDQASRTLHASIAGGTQQTLTFPAVSGAGVKTTPIVQMGFWILLENPTNTTKVFVDNLFAEEVSGT
jgi:hypothetical protein